MFVPYYIGLGTSTSAEAKEYFSHLTTHQIGIYYYYMLLYVICCYIYIFVIIILLLIYYVVVYLLLLTCHTTPTIPLLLLYPSTP